MHDYRDDVAESGSWTDDVDPAELAAWLALQTDGVDFDFRD
jgi:hypothetical protein